MKTENKNTVILTITQKMKFFVVNLTKYVQDLHANNDKMLMK